VTNLSPSVRNQDSGVTEDVPVAYMRRFLIPGYGAAWLAGSITFCLLYETAILLWDRLRFKNSSPSLPSLFLASCHNAVR
jgi:hypothetical protein